MFNVQVNIHRKLIESTACSQKVGEIPAAGSDSTSSVATAIHGLRGAGKYGCSKRRFRIQGSDVQG